ncbi:MAG: hypothetical protein I8H75_05980 [Myxococcaceae bacterium]|nr:hypothetical protein [Myxococcaceae bacterium]MBH2006864.1 hypothetical protein [Myxococcaceae bacterium]
MKIWILLHTLFGLTLFAQGTTIVGFSGIAQPFLNDCSLRSPLQVLLSGVPNGSNLIGRVMSDPNFQNACPSSSDTNAPGAIIPNFAQSLSNGLANVAPQDLLNGLGACQSPASGKAALCIYAVDAEPFKAQFTYDTFPDAVSIEEIVAGSKRLSMTLKDPKSAHQDYAPTYEVCFGTDSALIGALTHTSAACPSELTTTSATHITLNDLENFQEYTLVARVQRSQNLWSPSLTGTPIDSAGFSKIYDGASNPLSWSCTQTPSAPESWALFLLLLILIAPIRIRFLGALCLLSVPLWAHLGSINVGLTGSPYRPSLDTSTQINGRAIRPFYGPMFDHKLLPLMGLEVDIHLWDQFGSLQLGGALSYTYAGGKALAMDPSTQAITAHQSSDSVGLHLLHFRPQLTYALDHWVDRVPLVPYVRGGIVCAGYLFTYQNGVDQEGGANPMGFVFGYEAAAGLMLALDSLEPSVSRNARANGVYDHVYLKAEAAYMPIDNFHQKGLNFSPRWPAADFPLMLTLGLVFEFK